MAQPLQRRPIAMPGRLALRHPGEIAITK